MTTTWVLPFAIVATLGTYAAMLLDIARRLYILSTDLTRLKCDVKRLEQAKECLRSQINTLILKSIDDKDVE